MPALHEPIMIAHATALTAALLMTYLCCHPVIAYVRRGWVIKKNEVVNSLSESAKTIYLQTFLKQSSANPAADFESIYDTRYGRHRLVVPTVLLALVLFPLTVLVSESAIDALAVANGWPQAPDKLLELVTLPGTAAAAIVGAYTWIVASLISATASNNLPPGVVLSCVLRLVAAVPMGYAVASLAAPGIAPFVAFSIGAFPLGAVQLIFQKLTAKQLSLDPVPDERRAQVGELSGIDPPIADRLREADITTIPQLAYCDPVQVFMRTNLGFHFILDLVGQALAWIYFEQKLEALRPFGLRGAFEVRSLLEDLNMPDQAISGPAQATFNAAAKVIGIDPPDAFRGVCVQIADDPYTGFIWEVWGDPAGVLGRDL